MCMEGSSRGKKQTVERERERALALYQSLIHSIHRERGKGGFSLMLCEKDEGK